MSLKFPDNFLNKVLCMDCLDGMRQMPEESVDLIVTDPPYGFTDKNMTWPMPDCGIQVSFSNDISACSPESFQDYFDDIFFDSLSQACDSIRDFVSPTILSNRSYINHAHHGDDSDYSPGKELSQWPFSCQDDEDCNEKHKSEVLGFQCDCPVCYHLYDELIRLSKVGDRDIVPLLTDVLAHIHQFVLSRGHILVHQYNVHLSSCGGLHHILEVLVLGCSSASKSPLFKVFMAPYNYTSYGQKSQEKSLKFYASLLVDDLAKQRVITKLAGFEYVEIANCRILAADGQQFKMDVLATVGGIV